MPNYPPDPGGVFSSDVHRRVAAHLPVPGEDPASAEQILARVVEDVYTPIGEGDIVALERVLQELAVDGLAKELSQGWRLLKAGLGSLSGPAMTEVVDGQAVEPPPLQGVRLEEAEAQQRRIAEEDAEIEARGRADRVATAREELAAALAAQEGEA